MFLTASNVVEVSFRLAPPWYDELHALLDGFRAYARPHKLGHIALELRATRVARLPRRLVPQRVPLRRRCTPRRREVPPVRSRPGRLRAQKTRF